MWQIRGCGDLLLGRTIGGPQRHFRFGVIQKIPRLTGIRNFFVREKRIYYLSFAGFAVYHNKAFVNPKVLWKLGLDGALLRITARLRPRH